MLKPIIVSLIGFATFNFVVAQTPTTFTIDRPSTIAEVSKVATVDPALAKYREIYEFVQTIFGQSSQLTATRKMICDFQKTYPKSPYPLFALAEVEYALANANARGGESSASIALIEQAMRMGGASLPDGYILLSKMAADRRESALALSMANTAIQLAPNKPEAIFALARAEDLNGHYAQAEAAYVLVLRIYAGD